jgi:Reverse transcriptase (RNA-dependent DNA polymerase)
MDFALLDVLEEIEREERLEREQGSVDIQGFKDLIDSYNGNKGIFRIVHLNVSSICKHFDEILVLFETCNLRNVDMIVFSETRQLLNFKNFSIPGFDIHYNNGKLNQNDGVLIYVNSKYTYDIQHFTLIQSDITISKVKLNINNQTVVVVPCYRSPSTNLDLFISDLEGFLDTLENGSINILIGDFNVDILNSEVNANSRYLSMLQAFGYKSLINTPTRVTAHSSTCLDHIFFKKNFPINDAQFHPLVLNSSITDHYPIYLDISTQEKNNSNLDANRNQQKRYEMLDQNKFNALISKQNWENILNILNPQDAYNEFIATFLNIYSQCLIHCNNRTQHYKKIKPWITDGLVTSIKHRDKLKRICIKNKDDNVLRENYKTYRNHLNKLIKIAKNNYYSNQVDSNAHNIKKIYKIIAEASNETKNYSNNLNIVNETNSKFSDEKNAANYCNNYFITAGVNLASKIQSSKTMTPSQKTNIRESMFLNPITKNELIQTISTLKNNSAPGMDNISSKLVKSCHIFILEPLQHIINLIFSSGQIPKQFKLSLVTPIFKNGNKEHICNYRPISVINTFAKIFEKCLKVRLVNFLEKNNILHNRQYGFKPGFSTNDAMLDLIGTVKDILERGNKSIAIFLDLAKAFDTVPHNHLLEILESYGIRGPVLNLFDNYLTNREQILKYNDNLSDVQKVIIGVPQGTVLGPILFLIYINSLLETYIDGVSISYADDTVLIFEDLDWNLTKTKAINGLTIVKNWLDIHKLTLNESKTKYIAFSITDSNRPQFDTMTVHNLTIQETKTIKYLGITLDCHIKWTGHATYLAKKINRLIPKFYILRNILSKKVMLAVYKALVESVIRYGILVWGGMFESALQPVKVAQNYILKIIFHRNRTYPTELLYNKDIMNIRQLYFLLSCTLIHKNKDSQKYINHGYVTRATSNNNISIPYFKRKASQRYLNYIAPQIYNTLPVSLKRIRGKRKFMNLCRSHIFDNYLALSRLL